ncbi:MAG TPA: O-antigen ligase family protein [Caldilineaceae bacterium]|nr:O-antigen ligase family protein [Caldilineaceae bacterium]
MRPCDRTDSSLVGELLLLAAAAPALYFPQRFPPWAVYASLLLLAGGWVWRRLRLGVWYTPTPADWPIFLLFGVMLPISLWVAPAPLREQYSIPRAYILLWNFCLFWVVVTYGSRSRRYIELALAGFALLALAIALVAPLGMNWLYKFAGFQSLIAAIPSPLVGVFAGAETGFHPNQVAGTLLYALPLLLALGVAELLQRRQALAMPGVRFLVWLATPVIGLVLLLTQSRMALFASGLGVVVMVLVNRRWGRRLLVIAGLGVLASLPFLSATLLDTMGETSLAATLGGMGTLKFRQDVWVQAVRTIYDFPFTGIGLGTFRRIIYLLYPVQVSPYYDLEQAQHAHNFFLQTGLDFGLLGLVALAAIYLGAMIVLAPAWWGNGPSGALARMAPWWAMGLGGSLVAQVVHGQLDAVAMGAKTNLMFWYVLALTFALGNLYQYSSAHLRAQ